MCGFSGSTFFLIFDILRPVLFIDFVNFLLGVRFVEFWPVVLRLPGLHWLRRVLSFSEVVLIGPEARVLMISALLSLTVGALVCM